ncbi:MAG: SRPBCC family protein [Candidatus Omnitrophica bacterium]|nr:SRPBCC family protein [Candidatus Omnitrophota bacterium]
MPKRITVCFCSLAMLGILSPAALWAFSADDLLGSWPKQEIKILEMGERELLFRKGSTPEWGIGVAARFEAPCTEREAWSLITDFENLPNWAPWILAARVLEDNGDAKVIELDADARVLVFRKTRTLVVDVRLVDGQQLEVRPHDILLGEFVGGVFLRPSEHGCEVEVGAHLNPAIPLSTWIVTWVAHRSLLITIDRFLEQIKGDS